MEQILNHYVICKYLKGMFSDERTIHVPAIDGTQEHFDPDRKIGISLTETDKIMKKHGLGYKPIETTDISGEGFVQCILNSRNRDGTCSIKVHSSRTGYNYSLRVHQDNVQIIFSKEQIRPSQ